MLHLHQQVWTDLLTGDLRHTLQTFQSTLSIRQTESELQKEIKGTYLDNYRDIWNLYINNSTCAPAELAAKTGDDSRNEFLAGQAVFFQNGSWEYGNLTADGTFTDDDLAMIPIYIGVGDEANQGSAQVQKTTGV